MSCNIPYMYQAYSEEKNLVILNNIKCLQSIVNPYIKLSFSEEYEVTEGYDPKIKQLVDIDCFFRKPSHTFNLPHILCRLYKPHRKGMAYEDTEMVVKRLAVIDMESVMYSFCNTSIILVQSQFPVRQKFVFLMRSTVIIREVRSRMCNVTFTLPLGTLHYFLLICGSWLL